MSRSSAPRSRRACAAADIPAASPPMTTSRSLLTAPGCHPAARGRSATAGGDRRQVAAPARRNTLPGLSRPAGSSASLIARCTSRATGPISRSSQSTLIVADPVLAGDRAAEGEARARGCRRRRRRRARAGRRRPGRSRSSGACCRRRRARRRRSSTSALGGDGVAAVEERRRSATGAPRRRRSACCPSCSSAGSAIRRAASSRSPSAGSSVVCTKSAPASSHSAASAAISGRGRLAAGVGLGDQQGVRAAVEVGLEQVVDRADAGVVHDLEQAGHQAAR